MLNVLEDRVGLVVARCMANRVELTCQFKVFSRRVFVAVHKILLQADTCDDAWDTWSCT